MTKNPPKVKKIYQNTPGSEKMWFNVLKNAARDRAYDSFIRSFILYDGISMNTEHLEGVDEEVVRWYTPNRAFYWDLRKDNNWFPFLMTLGTTIAEHRPYLYFIHQAIREEYPDNWRVFSDLVKNNTSLISGLYQQEEEEPEEFVLTKRVYREIKYMFAHFLYTMRYNISDTMGQTNNPADLGVRRKLREIFSSIPTTKEIKREYERLNPPPSKTIQALLLAPFYVFKKHIENNHPYIVWEHIANFHSEYVADMEEEIDVGVRGDERIVEQQISYILNNDLTERVDMITDRIWTANDSDRDLLMENLPLDRLAE